MPALPYQPAHIRQILTFQTKLRRSFQEKRRSVRCQATVTFSLKQKVEWGDKMCVVGNHKELGRWELEKAPELRWNEGDIWTGQVELPAETSVEFKVVTVKGMGDPQWEDGSNRQLSVRDVDLTVDLTKVVKAAKRNSAPVVDQGSVDLDRLAINSWQGKGVSFMQSNEHKRDRSGQWDTSGLEGAALALVEGDQKSGRRAPSVLVTPARTLCASYPCALPLCLLPLRAPSVLVTPARPLCDF